MKFFLKIYRMDCAACSDQVSSILKKIPGIENVRVNFSSSDAEIEAIGYPDLALIEKRLSRYGYTLPKERVTLKTDPSEFKKAEESIKEAMPALYSIEKNGEGITLLLYPVGLRRSGILTVFRECGVPVEIGKWEDGNEEAVAHDQVMLLRKLTLSVFLTLPLLWNPSPYLQFILGTLILLIAESIFLRGAIRVFHGGMNMDLLIMLSSHLVYFYSTYLAFTVTEDIKLYYLCEGVLISLILFGRYLETVARGETERSLRGFINLLPHRARCVNDGIESEIDVDEIRIGDSISVLSGERIPADGIILEGSALVDESLLTGESALVRKEKGSPVTGGTILRSGEIILKVTQTGRDSTLEEMIDIVRQAQISSSPLKKKTDTIVKYFISIVIIISIAVFLLWFFHISPGNLEMAVLCSAGVLVVSCPCALGLAIPTSIMVGSGRSSEMGILFKNAAAIEKMQKIRIIAFDKTGTLTYGGDGIERNTIRKGAEETILFLNDNYRTVMISGDRKEIAEEVGNTLGIRTVYSMVKPEEKAEIIKELQKDGPVMMVGDGVNDAPAMAVSDISISIQNGTELARDTAEVILLGDDVSKLNTAFSISGKIVRNIRENLIWALIYNVISIPLAAAGIINPSIASAAMSFSSIAVLMNALRLRNMEG